MIRHTTVIHIIRCGHLRLRTISSFQRLVQMDSIPNQNSARCADFEFLSTPVVGKGVVDPPIQKKQTTHALVVN